jgi:hypothetical protein
MPAYDEYPISVYREGMIKIDDFVTHNQICIQHSCFGFRTIEIDLQANVDGADNLVPPNYIAVTTPTGTWGGVIYSTNYVDSIRGGARTKTLSVLACSPVGFFKKRYVKDRNQPGYVETQYYKISGTQEFVIKHFVNLCMSGDRKFPDFVVAKNLNRGDDVEYITQFESLYQIVDTIINQSNDLFYDVDFDETDGFTFDLKLGNDLSDTIYLASEQGIFSEFIRNINFLEGTNHPMVLTDYYSAFGQKGTRLLEKTSTATGYNLLETVLGVNIRYNYAETLGAALGRAVPYIDAYNRENPATAYNSVVNTDRQKYIFNQDFYLGDTIGIYYDAEDISVNTTAVVAGATEVVSNGSVYTIGYQWEQIPKGLSFENMKKQIERSMR